MGSPSPQTKAYLYALAAVLCWSTVASAFKLSLRHLDVWQLLCYSSLASTLVLGLILALQGRLVQAFRMSGSEALWSLAMGLMNPLVYYLILFKAYDLLPAQEAQPLNYTWAVTLALLSIPLLGQRITAREIVAVVVSYSGVVVIATRGDVLGLEFSNPLGVALALVSTLVWALYWIFNTRDRRAPVPGLFCNFLFSLPFVVAGCAVFSSLRVEDAAGLLGAAYVGVFEMGLTFVLWLSALRLSENTARVGNLIFLSPFLSLYFINIFVGEEILPSTYAGLVLIMAGLAIQRSGRKRPLKQRA